MLISTNSFVRFVGLCTPAIYPWECCGARITVAFLPPLAPENNLLEALHVSWDGNAPPSPECHAIAQIAPGSHEENRARRALNISKLSLFAVL